MGRERIQEFVRPVAEAGVTGIGIGGDHSVTLAELRALAAVHGQLGLVHLDSHTDLWDLYNGLPYSHGTMFRRSRPMRCSRCCR
jgi:agmatinase